MHAATTATTAPDERRAVIGVALGLAAALAYLLLCHWAIGEGSAWAPWLMLAPLSISAAGAAAYRWGRIAGLGVAAGLVVALAWSQPWMRAHGAWLYMAEHAGFYLALAALFGVSLFDARGALITRLARSVRGESLPARVETYTRRVTQAWTATFVAIAAVSVALFALAPLDWWSTFANLVAVPLVVAVFVGEYVVRRIVLRDLDHSRLMDGVRAFRTHQQQGRDPGPG